MKHLPIITEKHCPVSRPTRGAWIETTEATTKILEDMGRAPHGARGLKQVKGRLGEKAGGSRPTRGAWIETVSCARRLLRGGVAPHTGRVD